ncbi:hypothetical protein [Paeniglutamicibacter kerguelensis]
MLDSPDRGFAWLGPHNGSRRMRAFISHPGLHQRFIDEIAETDLLACDMN